jgi:hypothetical protein
MCTTRYLYSDKHRDVTAPACLIPPQTDLLMITCHVVARVGRTSRCHALLICKCHRVADEGPFAVFRPSFGPFKGEMALSYISCHPSVVLCFLSSWYLCNPYSQTGVYLSEQVISSTSIHYQPHNHSLSPSLPYTKCLSCYSHSHSIKTNLRRPCVHHTLTLCGSIRCSLCSISGW